VGIDISPDLSGADRILQHLFPEDALILQDRHISLGNIRIVFPALEDDGDVGIDNAAVRYLPDILAISCPGAVDAVDVCVDESEEAHSLLISDLLMDVLPLDDTVLDDLAEEVHLVVGIVEDGPFGQAGGPLDIRDGDFSDGGCEHQLESCVEEPFFVAFSHDDGGLHPQS